MKTKLGDHKSEDETAKPVGLARAKKEKKTKSPRILQSCVGLGCKFIF